MNTSTELILQCNQSEPLADASGRIVDLMNENEPPVDVLGLGQRTPVEISYQVATVKVFENIF